MGVSWEPPDLPMCHNEWDPIPKSRLKLLSDPWILHHIRHRTHFTATNIMPSSRDTSHLFRCQCVKSRHRHQIPRQANIRKKINPSACRTYATWISTTDSNSSFNFRGTDDSSLPLWSPTVSHGPSLLICWIKWRGTNVSILNLNGIALLATPLCNFFFERN